MHVLIIEDNISTAVDIEMILSEMGDFDIAKATTIEQAEKHFSNSSPDLIVADILLSGESSLSFLKDTAAEIPTIILTNHSTSEFYEESLAINALAYLMKPVDAVSLKFEIDRIRLNGTATINDVSRKTMIRDGQRIYMIYPDDIIWIKTEGNYSTIRTKAKKIVVKKSLSKILEVIDNHKLFRSFRSAMINLNFIDTIDLKKNAVMMIDGSSIPMSKKQRMKLALLLGEVYKKMI